MAKCRSPCEKDVFSDSTDLTNPIKEVAASDCRYSFMLNDKGVETPKLEYELRLRAQCSYNSYRMISIQYNGHFSPFCDVPPFCVVCGVL